MNFVASFFQSKRKITPEEFIIVHKIPEDKYHVIARVAGVTTDAVKEYLESSTGTAEKEHTPKKVNGLVYEQTQDSTSVQVP